MEPTKLPDEQNTPNNPSSDTNTTMSSEPSAQTSYREPVDLDAMMRGEDSAAFSSFSENEKKDVSQNQGRTPPSDQNPSVTVPDDSVATRLRKKDTTSPISRGPAPHLAAIAEEIKREKKVVDPDVILKKTAQGDPRFASRLMTEKKQAADESKKEALKRNKEATKRGEKKAEEVGKKHTLKSLRTFESDIAEAMKGNNTSMVQMVLAEHNTQKEKEEIVVKEKETHRSFLWGSIGLIVLSLGVITTGAWYIFTGESIFTILEPKVTTPIFVEKSTEFQAEQFSVDSLRTVVAEEVINVSLPPDAIEYIYVTELIEPEDPKENPYRRIANAERFSALVGGLIPTDMLRTLNEEHMFGVHAWNGNQAFLLFFTDEFDTAFSNMLKWEQNLPEDILPLIGRQTDRDTYTAPWEDYLVKNRDLRVVRDTAGGVVLAYTFFGRDTLIISTSIDTIDEIIARVIQERRIR